MRVFQGAAVFLFLASLTLALALTRPLDVSGNVDLPRPVERVKERDGVAYRAHRALGTALFDLYFPADAVALQWLKAAGHSRTERETDRAIRYFTAARTRAASAPAFDTSICRWIVDHTLNDAQHAVVARSGTKCG